MNEVINNLFRCISRNIGTEGRPFYVSRGGKVKRFVVFLLVNLISRGTKYEDPERDF